MTFLTPVLLGTEGLPEAITSKVVKYKKGSSMHTDSVPEVCEELPHGIMIDFPLTHTQEYIDTYLSWIKRRSDDNLVEEL